MGRLVGVGAVCVALLLASVCSDKVARDSRARLAALDEHAVSSESVEAEVERRDAERAYDPAAFATKVEDDARVMGARTTLLDLGAPQPAHSELDEAVVLAPGQRWASPRMRLTVDVQKIRYQPHGAEVSARHVVLTVRNVSDRPLAYFLQVRSHDEGRCDVRGLRMHNAMALLPDEQAEIVVCPGAGKVRVEQLQTLGVTELGYHYFAQVPPSAVGHDGVTTRAHRPLRAARMCTHIDGAALRERMAAGLTRWVDVADYFTRHDCHRFEFPESYRHALETLSRLPVAP